MTKVNRGKEFEAQIKKAFLQIEGVSIDRLYDPTAGYSGIKNICDFIVYKFPYEYYIECKTHYGNTLPFSCITDNQWYGMLAKTSIYGVVAGVMVWFIDHDKTFFVPIETLHMLKSNGKKSLHIKDMSDIVGVKEIPSIRKRILFDYNLENFLQHDL